MKDATPRTIYLKDYQPAPYLVERIDLRVELNDPDTQVRSVMSVRRNPDAAGQDGTLWLDGQAQRLLEVTVDGRLLAPTDYQLEPDGLRLTGLGERAQIGIVSEIQPAANTALEGLYKSGDAYCTQCEAEGFRRITYFPDRPDVMTVFTTTVVADRETYPLLLSNGNCTEAGDLDDGRHFATWHDPIPKSCYLFALVAGDLACHQDQFITMSGREVELRIYTEHKDADKTAHAMQSLKQSMLWDEQRFGREYDLDIYMVVAVDFFNMGAMENKGLNIFNSKLLLARPDTATDDDYERIQGVIAHEYFHNWSGNRVTCRDWFQLSLKEGFTVYRDQEFTADHTSAAVKRIDDVNLLRSHQFPEDASPMAHPVRPDSYVEINNFYTVTVYEKGAEVVRMLATLVGWEGFRRGTDLYFERHDGQAVTTDDFVRAIEDANDRDFSRFRRWYQQAGTPTVQVQAEPGPGANGMRLTFRQSTPPTPGQPDKAPTHIPLALGLIGPDGNAVPVQLEGQAPLATRVLELTEAEQSFDLLNVPAGTLPSLLRGFSAPVKLDFAASDAELALQLAHDQDDFNRWEAGQRLYSRVHAALMENPDGDLPPVLIQALRQVFARADDDPRLTALALQLPSEGYLFELIGSDVDPLAIHAARNRLHEQLAESLQDEFAGLYARLNDGRAYSADGVAIGRRKLKNVCLAYLADLAGGIDRLQTQYRDADNMTDRLAALSLLADSDGQARDDALADFYQTWRGEALVLDKWFSVQAAADRASALSEVKALLKHEDFNIRNPNRVRSLISVFANANPAAFHATDGSGYALLADMVIRLNDINPQIAARLLTPMRSWRRLVADRQPLVEVQWQRILSHEGLSQDVYEVATKSLAG